tara:strand:+ start:273 stop:554 length:282 start_codon:yes stop_codon:yes gene_type:complete
MKDKELKSIGKWLNTKGYDLDLSDGFWMEEWIAGEHKFRDIAQLLQDYHTEHLITVDVIKQYTEADMDYAYDKGIKDANQRDLTGSLIEVINK